MYLWNLLHVGNAKQVEDVLTCLKLTMAPTKSRKKAPGGSLGVPRASVALPEGRCRSPGMPNNAPKDRAILLWLRPGGQKQQTYFQNSRQSGDDFIQLVLGRFSFSFVFHWVSCVFASLMFCKACRTCCTMVLALQGRIGDPQGRPRDPPRTPSRTHG